MICRKCGFDGDTTLFSSNKNICKKCKNKYEKDRRSKKLAQLCATDIKTCNTCGFVGSIVEFSVNQSRCKKCTLEYKRKRNKENPEIAINQRRKWREKNPNYDKNYSKQNPEKEKKKRQRWQAKNPEYQRTYRAAHPENGKRYYENNKDKEAERRIKLKAEHPEKVAAYNSKYQNTPKGKLTTLKQNVKRRKLGHSPINVWFKGAEAHHLRYNGNPEERDNELTIYAPKKLHQSVRHNGSTGRNMKEINVILLSWYLETTPVEEHNPIAKELYNKYLTLPEPVW